MSHDLNSREVNKSSKSGPQLCEKSPKRSGWWHVDDMFIWGVSLASKSQQAWSVREDDSLSGAPCVWRENGVSLGVNSVTLRRVTWQVWPQSSFEQDNPGWHSRPVCWGIYTWRTDDLKDLRRQPATEIPHLFECGISYIKLKTDERHTHLRE